MSKPRILVVDDEAAVLTYIATILRRKGYDVYLADDASAALRTAETLSCGLNLLITDIVMPGMHGDELVRSIRKICPSVDVLVITGALGESSQGLANCRFLKKPFLPGVLVETVSEILDNQIY
jgi:DNA-binding response OmpR family regulator